MAEGAPVFPGGGEVRGVRKAGSVEERRTPLGLRHSRGGSMDLVQAGRSSGEFGGNHTGLSPEDDREGTDKAGMMGGMESHMRCASDVVTLSDAVGAVVSTVRDMEGRDRKGVSRVLDESIRKPPSKADDFSDTLSNMSLIGWLPEGGPPARRDGSDVRVGKQGERCVRMHSVGPGVPKVQKPRRKSHQWEGDDAEVEEGSTPKGRRNKPAKVDTDSLQSVRCSPSRCTKPMRMESM